MIILGLAIAFTVFIFVSRVKLTIEYNEILKMKIRIFGITIPILPKKPKKYNIRKYTKKKIERRRKFSEFIKNKKDELFGQKKKTTQPQAQQPKEEKKKEDEGENPLEILKKILKNLPSVPDSISLLTDTVNLFASSFLSHFHLHIARIRIKVGGADAAQTGILCGAMIGAFRPLICLIDRHTNLHGMRRADIEISPDFLSEEIKFDIKLAFSMSLAGFLIVMIKSFLHATVGLIEIWPKSFFDEVFSSGNTKSEETANATPTSARV